MTERPSPEDVRPTPAEALSDAIYGESNYWPSAHTAQQLLDSMCEDAAWRWWQRKKVIGSAPIVEPTALIAHPRTRTSRATADGSALRTASPRRPPMPDPIDIDMKGARFHWWVFVHNALIHPTLAFPYQPRWAQRAHDWTAQRCVGRG